eukprot:s1524_g1.t1
MEEFLKHSICVTLPGTRLQIALFLVKFHAKYTGRTDLRERKRNGFAVTAFDCVVFTDAIQAWFEARHAEVALCWELGRAGQHNVLPTPARPASNFVLKRCHVGAVGARAIPRAALVCQVRSLLQCAIRMYARPPFARGWCGLGLFGAWWLYASFSQSLRRRLRLGIWPIAEPNSLEKIVELCKGPHPPIAVGECWAYLTNLQYARPEERIIALGANWSGVVSMTDDTIRVRTGMLWGEVMRVLWEKNKAPMDRPAFDQMSIGASVRVAAHGLRKDGWFIDFLRAVQAVERGTGKVVEVKRGDYDWWKVVFGKEYIVTEAEFETQPNRLVFVTGQPQAVSENTTQQEVDQWVQTEALGWKDAPYVNMSVGSAAINRKWYTLDPVGVDEKNQCCLDYARRLVWADAPGIDSLGDAQTIIQSNYLLPFYCGSLFLRTANLELFVKTEDPFDWDKIALFLVKFHAKYTGRTDLRERKRNGFAVTAFDCVVFTDAIQAWFEARHAEVVRSLLQCAIRMYARPPFARGWCGLGLFGAWWLYASFSQSLRRRLRLGIWPIAEPNSLEKIAPMDRPAFDQMSIGASVRVAAHGFRKDGWFIDFVRAVQAVERGTGKVVEVKRGDYNWWKVVFGEEYIVTEAEFETQPNRLVFVTGQSQPASASTTQQEVDQWVQTEALGWKDAPYVNMSINGTAINRKWYTLDPVGVDEKTQSCLDYARRLVWADTPGIDSLGDAQTIIQQNFLISFYCGRQFLSIANVELFVKTEDPFDWDKIALFLVKFHAKYDGRTDLRERRRNGFTITAFDMVVGTGEEIAPWFGSLWHFCGSLWHSVTLCGTLWHSACDTLQHLRHFVALCGSLWLWHFVTLCGTLWHFVALCGTLWHFFFCSRSLSCAKVRAGLSLQVATAPDLTGDLKPGKAFEVSPAGNGCCQSCDDGMQS